MDRAEDVWARLPWGWIIIWAAVLFATFVANFKKIKQTTRVVTVFLIAGGVLICLVVKLVSPLERWGCVLALLPAVIILQHAVFLRLIRMPFRTKEPRGKNSDENDRNDDSDQMAMVDTTLIPVFAAARKNAERYFSSSTLAIRYGTPAVAVAVVGLEVYYLLFVEYAGRTDPSINAARFGVAGAYVYVLLYLGQRSFRHDVTSGGAMWCAVLLAVGPVLAWAISHFSHGDLRSGSTPDGSDTNSELLYFTAGLVPRHVASFVEEAVRRVWVSPAGMTVAAPRTIPITQVRGITTGIAERLAEEGILDLYALASADPLRLIRNTSFGKRQIISWIDEAILISVLPEHWRALEKEGFTGAIDVAWLKPTEKGDREPVDLQALSDRAKFDDVSIFRGVIERLSSDAQQRLIWVLYQLIDQLDAQIELQDSSDPVEQPVDHPEGR